MNLALDTAIAVGYKSLSQKARVVTESWAATNLFCLACTSDNLKSLRANSPVTDYICPSCAARYQLKSTSGAFGGSVANSAYGPKMAAIEKGRVPHYAFLRYSSEKWIVTDLFVVPGHFFTPAVIEKRPPLPPTARRAGWVGSNILLSALPRDARINVVENEHVLSPDDVREAWSAFAFLGAEENAKGGWGADVLMCVRETQQLTGLREFSLQDFYQSYESRLSALHPENKNVKAKIRQQLQTLRDNGVLAFLGNGRYRVIK